MDDDFQFLTNSSLGWDTLQKETSFGKNKFILPSLNPKLADIQTGVTLFDNDMQVVSQVLFVSSFFPRGFCIDSKNG